MIFALCCNNRESIFYDVTMHEFRIMLSIYFFAKLGLPLLFHASPPLYFGS